MLPAVAMNDEHAAALLADKFGPSSNNDPQTQPLASKPKYGTMPPITTTASLPTTGMSNSNSFSTSMAPHGIQPHGLGAKLGIYSQAEDHPQAMTTHAPFDDDDDPQQQVQAYAKLEGPQLCYYMRTLSVILGRTTASNEDIDIDLGQSKGISRKHARIFYNFMHQGFELQVFGKNGCFVDDVYVEKGITVSLHHK
ncbi:hypothetical protein H4219_001580 [Mycoemilia scoparia]|uniref:FHA domain-containing protein n=1 Tax=Mycoemilia scoparia TaxID=417184 RepID=A0A9W8DVW8_9FUNG|nr:hypothetical protein H4219_001580 [Mycoemilia scoparia]